MNLLDEIKASLDELKDQNQQILLAISKRSSDTEQMDILNTLPDRLRSRDIKKLFGISSVSIWNWEKKSILKPHIISGRKYYSKKDVMKLLSEKGK